MRFGFRRPSLADLRCGWLTRSATRLDAILPWDSAAVDATTEIKVALPSPGRR